MVTLTATGIPRFRLPTRTEWRAMKQQPSVLITLILCVTFILALFVAGIVFLSVNGYGTEALTASLVAPLVAALVNQSRALREVRDAVRDSPVIPTPPTE